MATTRSDPARASCRPHYMEARGCPRCGVRLLAAEGSEFVNEQWVRHFWMCEACGYQFATSVRVAERQAAEREEAVR